MNIVYFSNIFFTDCDFSLVRQYELKGHNVLYFISVLEGGTSGGLFRLNNANIPMGVTCANDIKEFAPYKDYIQLNNVYIVKSPIRFYSPINIKICISIIKLTIAFNPIVFHVCEILGVAKALLYILRKKMVLTVHDPFMHSGEYSLFVECKRWVSFKLVKKLILLNNSQKEQFINKYALQKKQFCIGRLGVYDALNCLQLTKSHTHKPYILFFGHISPYKGVDVLLDAMIKVHEIVPQLHCVIAGKGTFSFDVKPFESLDYIHFENRFIETDELACLINSSVFVVCPYKDATQSGVVASAFALSKPVLATNVGGLGESVINGVTGRLIEPNNSEQLTKAIVEMTDAPEQLELYSNNIKKIFWKGEKSWSAIADKYLEFYKS